MSDNPFIKVRSAGKIVANDNDTGGRRLLEAEGHIGEIEALRNVSLKLENEAPKKSVWASLIVRLEEHAWVVGSMVVAALICAAVGITGNVPW